MAEPVTPLQKGRSSAEDALDSTGKVIPVNTLALRKTEASSALKQAELERKFGEELRWHKKQAEHYQAEYEAGRARKKELEQEVESVRADLTKKLKDAQAEAEDLRTRGGDRALRAELEAVRRELDSATALKEAALAQVADSGKASARQLADVRERLAAANTGKQEAEEALAAARAEQAQLESHLQQVQQAQLAGEQLVQRVQEQLAGVTAELQAAQEATSALQSQVHQLQEDVSAEQQHKRGAEALAAAGRAELETVKQALVASQQESKVAKAEASQLKAKLEDAAHKADVLKSELARVVRDAEAFEREVIELKANASNGGALAAAEREALGRMQSELTDIRADYARAVYDMAKAKAEHSEMAGKLVKVLAQKDVLSQRLCVLQLAHTEVELAAKTGLDDLADQDSLGAEGAHQPPGSTSEGGTTARRYSTSGSARSVMSAGGGEAGAARSVLERVRKLAAEALTAATVDKRGHSLELENRRSGC